MRIQLLTAVTVTLADDTEAQRTVPLTLHPCEDCPDGGQVYHGTSTEYEDHVGHLRVGPIGRGGHAAMVSGGCPGDVHLSTAHGILRRATGESAALTAGLHSLARLTDEPRDRVERRERTHGGKRFVFERTVWADGSRTVRAYQGDTAEPFREWTGCGMWTDPTYLGECV